LDANGNFQEFIGSRNFFTGYVQFLSAVLSCKFYTNSKEDFKVFSVRLRITSAHKRAVNGGASSAASNPEEEENLLEKYSLMGYTMRAHYFSPERVVSITQLLLGYLLCLAPDDLIQWVNEPENFLVSEEQLQPSESLKCAAENLFLSLMDYDPANVSQVLLYYLQSEDLRLLNNLSDSKVLFYDAVFLAAGIGSSTLSRYIDPAQWIQMSLGPMISSLFSSPNIGAVLVTTSYSSGYAQIMRRYVRVI